MCSITAEPRITCKLILTGVKENNEVIVPTITFIATINSVLYTKASPIFMIV